MLVDIEISKGVLNDGGIIVVPRVIARLTLPSSKTLFVHRVRVPRRLLL